MSTNRPPEKVAESQSRAAPLGAAPGAVPQTLAPQPPRNTGRRIGWFFLVIILLLLCFAGGYLVGHARHTTTPVAASPIDLSTGVLLASPETVPTGTTPGTTVISWLMPPGTFGQVWVSMNGAPEVLFAGGANGAQAAPWIEAGKTYVFTLYPETPQTSSPLKTVRVTRP